MSLDVYLERMERVQVYEANITHNLGVMADMAGLYKALWAPEELGLRFAYELIPFLREGLKRLEHEPERFKLHDAKNKWGTYDDFVPWVRRYLEACLRNPDAVIRVSR